MGYPARFCYGFGLMPFSFFNARISGGKVKKIYLKKPLCYNPLKLDLLDVLASIGAAGGGGGALQVQTVQGHQQGPAPLILSLAAARN